MLEELGDPLAVLDVGLATGDLFDVMGVDQDDREPRLQEVKDGLPVRAGRLHRDHVDPLGSQPIGEVQEVARHGGEGPGVLEDLAGGVDPSDARNDGPLVNVQSGAAGMQYVHRRVSPWPLARGDIAGRDTLLSVLGTRHYRRSPATSSGSGDVLHQAGMRARSTKEWPV